MLALYRSGRQADAAAVYRRAHEAFAERLGIEPGVPLRELQRAILAQDPALDELDYQLGTTLERVAGVIPREPPEQVRSLYEYGCALIQVGEFRQGAATLRAAERMAATAGEPALEERARLMLSFLAVSTEAKSSLEHLAVAEHAARVFKRYADDPGLALALRQQALMLSYVGRCEEARVAAEQAIELSARIGNRWDEGAARGELARFLTQGTTPVGKAIEQCEEHLERCSTPESTRRVQYSLAVLHGEAGQVDTARRLSSEALEGARRDRYLGSVHAALAHGALVEQSLGAHAAAEFLWRSSYELLEVDELPGLKSWVGVGLARVLALSGDTAEAGRLAREARGLIRSTDDFFTEVLWRAALALVNAHEKRYDEAIRLSNEAVVRVKDSDTLLFRGQTLEDAATVRRLAGDRDGAVDMLRLALANYERKGSSTGAERVQLRLAAR